MLEFDRRALWLNRLFVTERGGLAHGDDGPILARRDLIRRDSRRHRLRPAPCSVPLGLLPLAIVPLARGRPLGRGRHGFQGNATKRHAERLLAQEPGDVPRLAPARHHGR